MAEVLTKANKEFCHEYVANGYKAVPAYIAVYNCKPISAKKLARDLLKKEVVKEYIKEIQKERVEALNISADRVLEELAKMAFADKDDKFFTPAIKAKALDMIQKQIGALSPQQIEATVAQVVFVDDTESNTD